jgi:hypothetical protein
MNGHRRGIVPLPRVHFYAAPFWARLGAAAR